MSLDLIIRDGLVVDGTGAAGFTADVGIADGKIVEVGRITSAARREIEAEGRIVTPGFIDGHTHMDAQINWDPLGTSACWHGITTVVMGNCGFTLAPSKEGERALVVRNLERAEDIAAEAMAEGITWRWETFRQYLDVVDSLPKGINYASNIGHSALRTWVMGERAFEEKASEQDLALMEAELTDALDAGAIGFTTSLNAAHQTSAGQPVASRIAAWEEVERLVGVLGKTKTGIFELAQETSPDSDHRKAAQKRLQMLALETGVPITCGIVPGAVHRESWEGQLALMDDVNARGGTMFGQTHCRGINVVLSAHTQLPFDKLPTWRPFRAAPIAEQKRMLRDPELRARLIEAAHKEEYPAPVGPEARKPDWDMVCIFDKPMPPYETVGAAAKRLGKDPVELMLDLLVESDFGQFFIQLLGQASDEDMLRVLRHPRSVMTFSDTGAHVSQLNDSSIQVHLLAHWARDRGAFTQEEAVRMVTSVPANAWGFADRGMIRPGMVADLNIIDYDRLTPRIPKVAHDLPGGAKRLISSSDGIDYTVVAGEILFESGEHSGALPGKLIRGPVKSGFA